MGENLWQDVQPLDIDRPGDVSPAYIAYRQFEEQDQPYKQVCTVTDVPLDTSNNSVVIYPGALLAGTRSYNRQGCVVNNIGIRINWLIRRASDLAAFSDYMRLTLCYSDFPTPSNIEFKRLTECRDFGGTVIASNFTPPPCNYTSGNFVLWDKVVYLPGNRVGGTGAVNFNQYLPNDNMSGTEYVDLRGFTTSYYGALINALSSTGTIFLCVSNNRAAPANYIVGVTTSLWFAD